MPRRPLVLLTTTLLLLVGVAPALADDPWTVPSPATITITGDGSGHGKGLSQYGAYGAARQGLTAQQILDFYYPGTHAGSAGGTITVLISGDRDADLVVEDRDGLEVRAVRSGKVFALTEKAARTWRVKQTGGKSLVAYRASGTSPWHTVRTISGDAELTAGGKPVTLRSPVGARAYRGALRSTHHDGRRVTVNVLPLEAYVRGVVPSEVAASRWPQQALRAQAVAARTYAAYERAHTANPDYDLCDTAACQAYGGATAEYPTSDAAVTATAHRVLTYQGGLAFAQFSASNGGYTVAGQFPYLPAQPDPYEGTSPDYYGWTATVTDAQIEQAYNIEQLTDLQINTRDGKGPRGGRVETVLLTTAKGDTYSVTGESFRRNLGLRSTLFEITDVQPG
ncbi:SpoIID/LytB domain protein [Nocardioides ginsengisegetis]|uniref:SpoIID/LytB domain protein n=1 Tax=Nocardioides ginsengisegetis TaxID=661491 RepID=A0A7W3IX81_9ACTN|nr:SpoIID/LytB domain-containing protein [Nocardioides ginsengisegetis]MBA8802293.1 SpoIID/LytB domain protein [Nocardioides ginsengisegetis]